MNSINELLQHLPADIRRRARALGDIFYIPRIPGQTAVLLWPSGFPASFQPAVATIQRLHKLKTP